MTIHIPIRELEDEPPDFDFKVPAGNGWYVVPITLRRANDFVAMFHRHTGRTSRNGGKFAVGLGNNGILCGAAIVGNPVSATLMDGLTAEVLRLCVLPGTPRGSCSQLYAACWRAWKSMGGGRMITYTLETEEGASLRGAGWLVAGKTVPSGKRWLDRDDGAQRTHTEVLDLVKNRWQITASGATK